MNLKIDLMTQQVPNKPGRTTIHVTVNRLDVPTYWKQWKPWASFSVEVPTPADHRTGLYLAVKEMDRRMSRRTDGMNFIEEWELVG